MKNGFMAFLNPKSWSIKGKAKLNFFMRAIVAIGLLLLMVNLLQKKMVVREANTELSLLSETKTKYITDYFVHLNQQLKAFTADRQTIDAFNQFSSSFLNIESDNYLSSSVTGLDRMNTLLEGFYKTEIIPQIQSDGNTSNLKSLLPDDNRQRILQYLYIASNTKPLGQKEMTTKADDGSAYSYMHAMYHPEILSYARQAGISDIIFVDYKTGYVVYSVKKNLDFATSLFDGPYKNSGLGMAFKSAISLQQPGEVSYTDASIYVPAIFEPQAFLSTPVYSGSQIMGAVIFAIDNKTLDRLLLYDQDISDMASLKSIIIGDDFLYRCDDPAFTADRERYIRRLKRHAQHGKTAVDAQRFQSTSMVQGVDQNVFTGISKDKQGLTSYTTETGSKVLCSYAPLKIGNLNWMLLTQVDKTEALAPLRSFSIFLLIIAFIIAAILYYLSGLLNNSISLRLVSIKENIGSLVKGQSTEELNIDSEDEISFIGKSVNNLNQRLQHSTAYINELVNGKIEQEFKVEGENDKLGIALNNIRQNLILRKEEEEKRMREDEIRNWSTHGIAMFNDILRTDNDNLEKLSMNIIRNIVQYLSANQGGLFLTEEIDEKKQHLKLIATYAYDRFKYITRFIEPGEGLAGTCLIEKMTILTNKIPDDYMTISSGLGGARPKCLLVVPLKKDNEVLGILEIASFENFKPHEVEFVEKVAESIASALITVKLHVQTTQYLERFQQQAEEMKAQDEELRQNIEELQATHEQMERLKEEDAERNRKLLKEMDDYRKLLISVLNEVPEKIFLKDDQGRFVIANTPVAENYGKTVDEILGKSDFDFYARDEATEYLKLEQEIIKAGRTQSYEEGDINKYDGKIVRTIKKPFYIEHLGVTGLFGVQMDITDIKRMQHEAVEKAEQLSAQEEELRQNLEEMQATQEDLRRQLDENEKMKNALNKEKALMDALMDNVPEHIYFKDLDSRFIRFSKSMLKLFGLKEEKELIGKSDFDFFDEAHSRPAFNDEQKIIKTGQAIIDLEEKEVMEDGRVSWVNTTKMPLRDANGKVIGTFGISKNISRIKNMETEALAMNDTMEKNRKLLIDVLNKVPAKIFLKDENGKFVIVNQAVASVYNKTPDQIIGTSDYDNHPDEDVDSWRKQELEIVRKGETTYVHKENQQGEIRYLNTTKTPFVLATTGNTGLLGIQIDVTDLKILEEEVKQLKGDIKILQQSTYNGKNGKRE
jgi:PAS domain S-box-containing protein